VQVKQPNNSGTTTYSYSGIVTTVTDPAGKWKTFENDALGNLVKVTEPRPGGGDYVSLYTYSELGQLLTTSMTRPGKGSSLGTDVTQTRTWVYDSMTQRLSSVYNPENGTDGSVLLKTDQKGQRTKAEYDTNGRVTATRRYANASDASENLCGKVSVYYDSQTFNTSFTLNATGRVAATETGCENVGVGKVIEMYSYTAAGAVTKKRLRIVRSTGTVDKDVTYGYGADGKPSTVLYPGTSAPYTYTYDLMDRHIKMTGPLTLFGTTTVDLTKDVVYGVAGSGNVEAVYAVGA